MIEGAPTNAKENAEELGFNKPIEGLKSEERIALVAEIRRKQSIGAPLGEYERKFIEWSEGQGDDSQPSYR